MGAFLATYGVELIFGLISAGALAFCKYLWSKNKQLQNYKDEDQNRKYRQMILDEIEPIVNELSKIHTEINQVKSNAKIEHSEMYKDLHTVQDKNDHNFDLILNSYKFRLIQLCKIHLKDDYITEDDFEQIAEFFKLYKDLGGNGQAEDYYNKVLQLDVR